MRYREYDRFEQEQREQKTGTYFTMVCSYILVFLLPVLVCGMLIYYIFMEPVNEQAMQLTIDDAAFTLEACERQVQQASTFYGMFLSNNRLANSLNPAEFDQVQEIMSQMRSLKASTSSAEAFLYCTGDQYLYSSASSFSVERFLDFYPMEGVTGKAGFLEFLGSTQVSCARAVPMGDDRQGLMLMIHESGNPKYLFFYLPQSSIESLFANAMRSNSGLAMIHVNGEARPLAHVFNDGLHGMDDYLSALHRVDPQLMKQTGTVTCQVRVGRQDCVLVSARASTFGLRYTTILYGDMEKRLQSVTLGYLLMMLVTLLIGITLALLISRRNYQPIRRLRSKASELVADGGDKNDYANIYNAMENLGHQNMLMRSSVSDMQAYLTHKLFKGDMKNVEENNQLQRFFGITAYASIYRVCVLYYLQPIPVHEMNRQVRSLLPEGVQMIAQQQQNDRYAVIMIGSDQSRDAITEVIKRLSQEKNMRCVSAGHLQYEMQMIPISYVEAMVTGEIMLKGGMTGLLMYSAIASAQPCTVMVEEVERALIAGDAATVQSLLSELKQRLSSEESSLPELQVLSNNLMIMLRRYCEEKGKGQLALDCAESYMILQYQTAEDFRPLINTLCERFSLLMSKETGAESEDRQIDDIQQYLSLHYNDPNLSVQQLADDYEISMPTMSGLLKRRTGLLPNDYIAKLRMDQAKRLLIRTDLTVAEIGIEVGFLNVNSFIRRFKQLNGVTPGDYRRQAQERF